MSKRFVELSWKIIESKMVYYRPDLVHKDHIAKLTISDAEYDRLENEYKRLANKLNLPASAHEMVGFDLDRPCCRMVAEWYGLSAKAQEMRISK